MSKTKSQLEAELKELKAHMRALTEAQAATADAAPAPQEEEEPAESTGGITADFEELMDLLKREIDGIPTMTCLAVFGLGVVTGRLLAN